MTVLYYIDCCFFVQSDERIQPDTLCTRHMANNFIRYCIIMNGCGQIVRTVVRVTRQTNLLLKNLRNFYFSGNFYIKHKLNRKLKSSMCKCIEICSLWRLLIDLFKKHINLNFNLIPGLPWHYCIKPNAIY